MNHPFIDLLDSCNHHIDFREKRPGVWQLISPFHHEDGDMLDIFLVESPSGGSRVRVLDYGMTLMRLSYAYDIDTENKERIFGRILSENRLVIENGAISIDVEREALYPAILHFAQTIGKVMNMQLYKREVIESLFYEQLDTFITENLAAYHPQKSVLPLEGRDEYEVDYMFNGSKRPIYLFGVKDSTKARLTTISCLEFQNKGLPFRGVAVHQDFDRLTHKDRKRITSAADKQFPSLEDFQSHSLNWFQREAYAINGS